MKIKVNVSKCIVYEVDDDTFYKLYNFHKKSPIYNLASSTDYEKATNKIEKLTNFSFGEGCSDEDYYAGKSMITGVYHEDGTPILEYT